VEWKATLPTHDATYARVRERDRWLVDVVKGREKGVIIRWNMLSILIPFFIFKKVDLLDLIQLPQHCSIS
jgi:hypothetical protein